ncbi:hypothetical protein QO011_005104 [Labrys wisconsinensis]|uniref:Uncharacterized protein n=1 Tax=Labrys wisconsinensis TaxID=425677 RepID=A0ABU0JCQ6_9HYPH|nr:hypothetical protein [Labrys wisconsinensis]
MDEAKPGGGHVGGSEADRQGPPADRDHAFVRPMDACEHLDHRGLAGAVLAEKGVNLARLQVEIDAGESTNTAEALDDAFRREKSARRHCLTHSLRNSAA